VQLYDILEETIWQLTPNAEKKKIQFINTIERIELMGDRNRLKQIFLNVVQNAIKYSHEKGIVHIEATKNEGQALIKVKDEGIGIAKEHLPYIEKSFYQINNHATGAGIGLAIVKKMVELHGGTLSIMSKEGIGTIILIKLPL
jgi:signal transduction histidine kinase